MIVPVYNLFYITTQLGIFIKEINLVPYCIFKISGSLLFCAEFIFKRNKTFQKYYGCKIFTTNWKKQNTVECSIAM